MNKKTRTYLVLATAMLCSCRDEVDVPQECEVYSGDECAGPEERTNRFDALCSGVVACCEGTEQRDYVVPVGSWLEMSGEGLPDGCVRRNAQRDIVMCVACGDGVCDESALESFCVCPEDCPEAEHNPCAGIEAKFEACDLESFERQTCAPYLDCTNACMLEADCEQLDAYDESDELTGCLAACMEKFRCFQAESGEWKDRFCDLCPSEPPELGTHCGPGAHQLVCHYPSASNERPYDICTCEAWSWQCVSS